MPAAAAAASAAASSPLLGSGAAQQLGHHSHPPLLTVPALIWQSGPWPGSPGAAVGRSGALQGDMRQYQAVMKHPWCKLSSAEQPLSHLMLLPFRSDALQDSITGTQAVPKRQRQA